MLTLRSQKALQLHGRANDADRDALPALGHLPDLRRLQRIIRAYCILSRSGDGGEEFGDGGSLV